MMPAAWAAVTGALSRNPSLNCTSSWRMSSAEAPSGQEAGGISSSSWAWLMCPGSVKPRARSELTMMSVPTCPGMTTAARTWGAWVRRSSMSASVKPRTANLAVL